MKTFAEVLTLMSDFFILEQTGFEKISEAGLVGKDSSNLLHIVSEFDTKEKIYKNHKSINTGTDTIVNVISQNFIPDTDNTHLVTSIIKSTNKYKNILYNSNGELKYTLQETTAIPFLIANPATLTPLLILQEDKETKFYNFENETLVENIAYRIKAELSSRHTSAFVDVSGDLIPNLILHCSNNLIKIYNFSTESQELLQEIQLPDKIGPILYFDSNNTQTFDMVYVSIENNISYLNIHENKGKVPSGVLEASGNMDKLFKTASTRNIYNQTPEAKINLTQLLKGQAIIKNDDELPAGVYLADLEAKGSMDLLISMDIGGIPQVRAITINQRIAEIARYNNLIEEYKNVKSVCVSSFVDQPKEAILINYLVDGKLILVAIKTNISSENSKVNLLTIVKSYKSKAHLPGVTYFILYDGERKLIKVYQPSHSSYPSLQHPGQFIGLGSTNFFLSYVFVRTSSSDNVLKSYKAESLVVPNTMVVFNIVGGKWTLQSFFSFDHYYKVGFGVIVCILVNVVLLGVLAMREKKNFKLTRNDENMKPIFTAL